ncbi:MAG: NUDIX hydrolase [Frankiaceae bacterium]|nr:NUDIX hydrolase [Arenimonas sp.]
MDDPIETVYEGKWLRMKRRGRWEFAERTNAGGMAVIIIAVTPGGNLVFVEQERIPVEGKTIEMPAGLVGDIDGAESIELAASRELLEETGWQAGHVELLMSGPTSSGMSNERVAFVRARDLVRVHAGGGDDREQIIVHEVPVADAPAWMARKMAEGYQLDAKLWAGLWLLDRNPDGSPA